MSDITALVPSDSHKSFYGKAHVISEDGKLMCKSYETIVAEYEKESDTITINGYYSPTTARHINSFCDYVGKERASKNEMLDCVSY